MKLDEDVIVYTTNCYCSFPKAPNKTNIIRYPCVQPSVLFKELKVNGEEFLVDVRHLARVWIGDREGIHILLLVERWCWTNPSPVRPRSLFFFFLSGLSLTATDNSQDSRERKGTIFYSTLPLPPAHEQSDIYLQLCMWGNYHMFLIETLVFTRLQLYRIYHIIKLSLDWLMMWC